MLGATNATSLCDLPGWARRSLGKPNSMPLQLDSLYSAVRITDAGDLKGTGFLVRVRSEAGHGSYSYLVTAHHVIRSPVQIEVEVPNPFANGALYPPKIITDWRQPLGEVDLAIAPYDNGDDQSHYAVWSDAIWPGHPDLGGQIYYVGMFEPLNRPMARAGTIGALEQEGLRHSQGRYDFPAHLVDCRSYEGFSGSPCSMEVAFARLDGKDVPAWVPQADLPLAGMNYYTLLCGMFTAHYTDNDPSVVQGVVSRAGVGVMLPGRLILEALMTEDARKERRGWDKDRALAATRGQPSLEDASVRASEPDGDEFSRFEDLTRKLVNVPKKALDEKRKAEG